MGDDHARMISRERLEERRAELEQRLAKLAADINATRGAIQLCDLLLAEIAEREPLSDPGND